MVDDKEHSTLFGDLIGSLLSEGLGFRFRARGRSMHPTIQDAEILHVRPVSVETLGKGDTCSSPIARTIRPTACSGSTGNRVHSSLAEMRRR